MNNLSPIIIDTDPGVDDAMAILFALLSKVDIAGFTTVYGNSTVANSTRNMLMLLALCNRTDIAVYEGAEKPLCKNARMAESHGATGLGTFSIVLADDACSRGNASEFLKRELSENTRTLVCLGPLTNIARALQSTPGIAANIDRIILLGGGFDTKGNVSEYAEFNIYNDPDALRVILLSGVSITIIPLEVCRKVMINKQEFDAVLAGNSLQQNVHAIVDVFIEYYQNNSVYGGFTGAVMYDLLVVGYFLFPEIFVVSPACVEVDITDTETRGRTTRIKGMSNALIVTDVDASALKKRFFAALLTLH